MNLYLHFNFFTNFVPNKTHCYSTMQWYIRDTSPTCNPTWVGVKGSLWLSRICPPAMIFLVLWQFRFHTDEMAYYVI